MAGPAGAAGVAAGASVAAGVTSTTRSTSTIFSTSTGTVTTRSTSTTFSTSTGTVTIRSVGAGASPPQSIAAMAIAIPTTRITACFLRDLTTTTTPPLDSQSLVNLHAVPVFRAFSDLGHSYAEPSAHALIRWCAIANQAGARRSSSSPASSRRTVVRSNHCPACNAASSKPAGNRITDAARDDGGALQDAGAGRQTRA